MNNKPRRQAKIDAKECVACGVCMNTCPFQAIEIFKGVHAKVDSTKCVGCGKCMKVCPASIIIVE